MDSWKVCLKYQSYDVDGGDYIVKTAFGHLRHVVPCFDLQKANISIYMSCNIQTNFFNSEQTSLWDRL